ncbi:MAG: hypothetical protein HUK11_06385 [Muribaculaceae bacterium]|nr:hypothetical protein [Muribaculaceae bacterium]
MRKKQICLIAALLMACSTAMGQVYSGEQKFDGEHKHEVSGYLQGGQNVVIGGFGGPAAFYKHHFTQRWDLEGGLYLPFGHNRYGMYARGSYRLPIRNQNLYFMGKMMYNRYQQANSNEYAYNLSVKWEHRYVDILLGITLVDYSLLGSHYFEKPAVTAGLGVNIRPRENRWNLGLFIRNYDDFYYDNWNINWGIRYYCTIKNRLRNFGELNIRPAGSLSQLATKYEASIKTGLIYTW